MFSVVGTLRKGKTPGTWVLDEIDKGGRPDGTRVFPLKDREVEVYSLPVDLEAPMLRIGPEGVRYCDCCEGTGRVLNAHEKVRCPQCNWTTVIADKEL